MGFLRAVERSAGALACDLTLALVNEFSSGCLFDGWVGWSGAGSAAFGAAWSCSGGFWWVGWCADRCGKCPEPSADACG